MEIPIQLAVRIFGGGGGGYQNDQNHIVQSIPGTPILSPTTTTTHGIQHLTDGIINVDSRSFPVTHALPLDVNQNQIYLQTVYPLIAMFLEGFDASIVTYGQRGTGKTYTLFGPGMDCVYGESEQGIVQRCVRDIFAHLSHHHEERNFVINISWIEIGAENEIRDLLDADSVQCVCISDVFQWLQIGMGNRSAASSTVHNLFTLTLEQQWITPEGIIQHLLSTASFCDLCCTDRMLVMNSTNQHISVPKDLGLQALERIVYALIDPSWAFKNGQATIQYDETRLTALLKDSFGGRAQTLMILCVSPLECDVTETVHNLQFAFKTQCVRNFVVLNTYSDNNTVVNLDTNHPDDTFGLQIAASQWLKLVSNAEGLFSKLIGDKTVNEQDRERIEEWLFLKQECEECLSSGDMNMMAQRGGPLGPIQEADERDDTSDHDAASCQQNTDNESDSEEHPEHPDLDEKVGNLMGELRERTDTLIKEKYDEFIQSHPKAVVDSTDSFVPPSIDRKMSSPRGRRKSIQPGNLSLSSIEIAMLNKVATREQAAAAAAAAAEDNDCDSLPRSATNAAQEALQNKLRKIITDLDASQRQMKELENTISLKQKLISDLIKNNDTRTSAKQRFNKKKSKLEAEYEKVKKQLSKAVVNGKDKIEIERLKMLTSHIEQRLQDLVSIKHIAGESSQKLKQHQQSLQVSKKQLEALQKTIKKDKKLKESLENDLKNEKFKSHKSPPSSAGGGNEKGKLMNDVAARISHLDHVLKEKSQNLEQCGEAKESLRHEIRNLRRTRDHLLEQRCCLDRKLKKDKMLSHKEERKLLECDEAIEAIDAAIEFKNELICGRKSIDTSDRIQREKGEQMLMERLNKLSVEEMRTLLYKYFQKVIDLRDSSRKLEGQLMSLERERDAWEWRERVLNNAVRQARLEGESRAVLLQQQQEAKVALMLRHFAEETSASSSLTTDRFMPYNNSNMPITTTTTTTTDSDLELDLYKPGALTSGNSKQIIKARHTDLDLCRMPIDPHPQPSYNKYKPLDKIKEKDRESKNKLFAKFQVLARYHGSEKRKVQDSAMSIPEQNLKQLQSIPLPMTKVTREKNKIIIQQDSMRRHH